MTLDENTYGFSRQDAGELINMIGSEDSESVNDTLDGRHAIIVQTPEGGIPARSGATVGKATCTIFRVTSADALESTGVSVSVINLATEAVAGSVYGQAKRASGRWVLDYEECP